MSSVPEHYGGFAKLEAIVTALEAAGLADAPPTPENLAPYDHLHTGGLGATRTMIDWLAPSADDHILDVGCGIGGPARLLALAAECRVSGLDLTPQFVATAIALTTRCDMADRVAFQEGSATAMPFDDHAFDGAWHIHMSMNVADKNAMYREIARVLKPGSRFVLFDPVAGPDGPPSYPVPWSRDGSTSFLLPAQELIALIEAAGFEVERTEDATPAAVAAMEKAAETATPATPSPPATQPADFKEMAANHRHNLRERRIAILRAAFTRL